MPGTTEVAVAGRSPLGAARTADAVRAVLRGERRRASISVTFVGRDRMRSLNQRYTGSSRATDVLAFGLPQPGGGLAGDVYVCTWRAREQARAHRVTAREEVLRLVVHGTLHVLGWEHPEDDTRDQSDMWRRQERYVRTLR
jgi:probable rRNA maturation factor